MKDLYIVPLCLGHIIRDKSAFTYLSGMGVTVSLPIIAWFIGGAEQKILVDTGVKTPEQTADFHHPMRQTEEQKLHTALEMIGLHPDDIDIVINTHLHWDHCSNNHLFQRARFFVQREELRYAASPLPIHTKGYDLQNNGMGPPLNNCRLEVVDGDVEIAPGVTLIYTPGHTPGSQGVLVGSTKGKVFLAGDTIPLFENWKGPTGDPNPLPNGVHVDLEVYYRTFAKIQQLVKNVDVILPGHDPLVFNRLRYP